MEAGLRGKLPQWCVKHRSPTSRRNHLGPIERQAQAARAARARWAQIPVEQRSEHARQLAQKRWDSLPDGGRYRSRSMHGPPGPCRYCSSLLPTMRSKMRVCNSQSCRKRYNADRNRSHVAAWAQTSAGRASKQKSNARRRAALRKVDRIEYDRRDIFERDRWRCQICGQKVDPGLVGPDRRSATIDHIIPLTDGGPDAPHNVQLAHYSCNSAKRDRAVGSQLRLAV